MKALLTSDVTPEVRVSTAEVAYAGIEPRMLTDDDVVVRLQTGEIVQTMEYDPIRQTFVKNDILIESGSTYSIQVDPLEESNLPEASGSSLIPEKVFFDSLAVLDNLSYLIETDIFQYIYNVQLLLPKEKKGNYYYIEPVSRFIRKEGEIKEYEDVFNPYTVNELLQSSPALKIANNARGVLVNFAEDPALSSIELNISLNDRFNRKNQNHTHIYFYLHNISEEYYLYMKNGGEINDQKDVYTEPIIEYSNVIDGRGIVGGAGITLDSMLIQ